MHIIVMADAEKKSELFTKRRHANLIIEFISDYGGVNFEKTADAFFILTDDINIDAIKAITQKPVFINSVISTLSILNLPANVSRINGWSTFLKRDLWEIATKDEMMVKNIFEKIGWKYVITPDEPGLIAARIIAMIINEAYFTLEQGVSTKDEIDIAMRLGTNYPYGPFEWAQIIGLKNIYKLLNTLKNSGKRYEVAAAMENDLVNNRKPIG